MSTVSADSLTPVSADFFERDVHTLAIALLGCHVVRTIDGVQLAGKIVEVEAYGGSADAACHADSGRPTARTQTMFGPAGRAYVYQIYGMYHCLNVVAVCDTHAAAVLIRALEPVAGDDVMRANRPRGNAGRLLAGPGCLCQAMQIDRGLDAVPLWEGELFLSPATHVVMAEEVATGRRIGLNPKTTGAAHDYPWRYGIARSKSLSKPF